MRMACILPMLIFIMKLLKSWGLLASEVAKMEDGHRLLIRNNLHINNSAWGFVIPSGQSELTFFPLYIGETKLILVIGGMPDLNKRGVCDTG